MKTLTRILLLIGILKIFAAAGSVDYFTGIGVERPLSETAVKLAVGFLLMVPYFVRKAAKK